MPLALNFQQVVSRVRRSTGWSGRSLAESMQSPSALVVGLALTMLLLWGVLSAHFNPLPPADSLEQVLLSQDLRLEYGKHPPMPTWILHGVNRLFGASIGATFVIGRLVFGGDIVAALRVGAPIGRCAARRRGDLARIDGRVHERRHGVLQSQHGAAAACDAGDCSVPSCTVAPAAVRLGAARGGCRPDDARQVQCARPVRFFRGVPAVDATPARGADTARSRCGRGRVCRCDGAPPHCRSGRHLGSESLRDGGSLSRGSRASRPVEIGVELCDEPFGEGGAGVVDIRGPAPTRALGAAQGPCAGGAGSVPCHRRLRAVCADARRGLDLRRAPARGLGRDLPSAADALVGRGVPFCHRGAAPNSAACCIGVLCRTADAVEPDDRERRQAAESESDGFASSRPRAAAAAISPKSSSVRGPIAARRRCATWWRMFAPGRISRCSSAAARV